MIYMSPKEVKELLSRETEFKILDVRENYEHDQCNISCMHIPMSDIKNNLDNLKKIKKIAFMCRSGKRAEAVAGPVNPVWKAHIFLKKSALHPALKSQIVSGANGVYTYEALRVVHYIRQV